MPMGKRVYCPLFLLCTDCWIKALHLLLQAVWVGSWLLGGKQDQQAGRSSCESCRELAGLPSPRGGDPGSRYDSAANDWAVPKTELVAELHFNPWVASLLKHSYTSPASPCKGRTVPVVHWDAGRRKESDKSRELFSLTYWQQPRAAPDALPVHPRDRASHLISGQLVSEQTVTLAGFSPSAHTWRHCRWQPWASQSVHVPSSRQAGSRDTEHSLWMTQKEQRDVHGKEWASGCNSEKEQWERNRMEVFPRMGTRKSRFPLLISVLQLLITDKSCSIQWSGVWVPTRNLGGREEREWGLLRVAQLCSEFTEVHFGTSRLNRGQSLDHKIAKSPFTDFTKGVVWKVLENEKIMQLSLRAGKY